MKSSIITILEESRDLDEDEVVKAGDLKVGTMYKDSDGDTMLKISNGYVQLVSGLRSPKVFKHYTNNVIDANTVVEIFDAHIVLTPGGLA